MSDVPPRLTALAFLLPLALGGGSAAADPLHLPPEAARGFQALDDGAARLQRARAAMEAIQAHRAPTGVATDWEGAPALLQSAADQLRRSEGPALPDAGGYAMGTDQLRACATRAAALGRAERLQRGALADAQRCGETRAAIKERLALVQHVDETRRALLAGSPLVTGDADAGALFTWRWADLDRPLSTALAAASVELKRWLDRVERAQADLKARAGTLGSLQAEWGRQRDCVLAGQWAGTRMHEGTVAGLSLKLAPVANGWAGTMEVNGTALPVKSVTLKGNAVSFTAGAGQATLNGTLSPDEQVLKGTYSSMDGPATFTLRKQ